MSNDARTEWWREFEQRLKIADHKLDNFDSLRTWTKMSSVPIAWPPGVREHLVSLVDKYAPLYDLQSIEPLKVVGDCSWSTMTYESPHVVTTNYDEWIKHSVVFLPASTLKVEVLSADAVEVYKVSEPYYVRELSPIEPTWISIGQFKDADIQHVENIFDGQTIAEIDWYTVEQLAQWYEFSEEERKTFAKSRKQLRAVRGLGSSRIREQATLGISDKGQPSLDAVAAPIHRHAPPTPCVTSTVATNRDRLLVSS